MGVGIVEPAATHVPGTVRLFDDDNKNNNNEEGGHPQRSIRGLKHGTGKYSHIVLVPQPSDSPNDPLNWPKWKRNLTLLVVCLAGAVAGVIGPAIAPVTGILVKEFETTYTEVAIWSGWQFWSAGIAGLLSSVIGRIWGKRPVYLVSIALVFGGAIWNSRTTTAGGFRAARLVQGFGLGVFESIIPSTVGDLFYVHERGKRIAFYNLAFLGCTYFMPILGGYISMKHSWRTQFIIISCFMGPILVLAFFLLPEHAYNRPQIFDTDTGSRENLDRLEEHIAAAREEEELEKKGGTAAGVEPVVAEKKKTWIQDLKIYNGRFSDENIFKCLLAPFVLMLYPATIWSFFFQGTFITWGIGVSIILAQLFAGPPTNFGPEKLGYMYSAPFLGAVLSYFTATYLSDNLAQWMARRNNNIYEPEFRILLVIPTTIFAIPGLFAFGFSSAPEHYIHWIIPSICYGLLTFAVVMSCTATFSYILDAHRDVSLEMMIALLVMKNFWAWGSTYFLNDWVVAHGPEKMFYIIGAIQTVICASSILMYVYGKVARDYFARNNWLKMAGLYPKTVVDVSGH